jgi:hypothetical protein
MNRRDNIKKIYMMRFAFVRLSGEITNTIVKPGVS